jgi:hypothetical protein
LVTNLKTDWRSLLLCRDTPSTRSRTLVVLSDSLILWTLDCFVRNRSCGSVRTMYSRHAFASSSSIRLSESVYRVSPSTRGEGRESYLGTRASSRVASSLSCLAGCGA